MHNYFQSVLISVSLTAWLSTSTKDRITDDKEGFGRLDLGKMCAHRKVGGTCHPPHPSLCSEDHDTQAQSFQ